MKQQHKITLKSYVQYLIQCRNEANVLHMGGKLFQQYVVDQFLRIEQQNLMFIRNNQQQLRAECYQGIVDALGGNNSTNIGHQIIVPATTIGSTRYMQQRFQDSMALVRKFGKPDLFLTMTCNPKWPEITQLLEPHQKAQDRFDIVTRVFHIKLHKMMQDIVSKKIFGATKSDNKILTTRKLFLPSTVLSCWTKNETYHYWKNQYCSYSNSTFEMAFVVGVAPILVHSSIHATLIDVVAVPNRYEYGLRYAVADCHFHPHFS